MIPKVDHFLSEYYIIFAAALEILRRDRRFAGCLSRLFEFQQSSLVCLIVYALLRLTRFDDARFTLKL